MFMCQPSSSDCRLCFEVSSFLRILSLIYHTGLLFSFFFFFVMVVKEQNYEKKLFPLFCYDVFNFL